MNWDVTYRGKGGGRVVERVEAASRDALFRSLEARGIKPIRIEEAKGGRAERMTQRRQSRGVCPDAIAAIVVIAAILGGVWWWCGRDVPSADTPPPKVEKPKSKPIAVPKPKPKTKTPETNDAPVATVTPPKRVAWRDPKLSEEQRLESYEKSLAESPLPNTSSNRLFRSGIEQVMGWIFTTEVGDMPPPLPRIPDFDIVHLQEILDTKNEISESDTEKQADTKNTVDFVKAELKKYLEKGGDPDEFMKYYHDQLKTAHQHRQIVQDQVMKVLQEEPELAEEFLNDANKGLAEMGIKAVVIPERIKQRLGLTSQNKQGEK